MPTSAAHPRNRGALASTHWSLIHRAAGDLSQPQCRAALEQLCAAYWYPLYVYLRRRGYSADEAEDFVQGFFKKLLEDRILRQADQRRGRFRGFLLAAMRHYIGRHHQHERAKKRGGGLRQLSLDFADAERRWAIDPADGRTPEAAFDRQWALELLRRVLHEIAEEYHTAGKAEWFETLECYLTPAAELPSYVELSARLGVTTTAAKVAVHRLRQTYRRRLEAEIAATVDAPEEIGSERDELLRAVRRD